MSINDLGDDIFMMITSYCTTIAPLLNISKHHRILTKKQLEIDSNVKKTIEICYKLDGIKELRFKKHNKSIKLYYYNLKTRYIDADTFLYGFLNRNFLYTYNTKDLKRIRNKLLCDYIDDVDKYFKLWYGGRSVIIDNINKTDIENILTNLLKHKHIKVYSKTTTKTYRYNILCGKSTRHEKYNYYDDSIDLTVTEMYIDNKMITHVESRKHSELNDIERI